MESEGRLCPAQSAAPAVSWRRQGPYSARTKTDRFARFCRVEVAAAGRTSDALGAIEGLTDAAWRAPWSTRVDSLTNYSHSEAIEDDLVVEPLVDDAQSLGDADVAQIEAIALSASDVAERLVSHDGRVAGLVINFALPENPDAAVVEITDYLDALLDEARTNHPDKAGFAT